MNVAEPTPELLEKARTVHQHSTLLREFILRGREELKAMPPVADHREPTWTQLRAMMVLATLGPCTLKEFAREMDVAPASASEMIDRLHESGWVSRDQDKNDRRRIVIELTKEARDCSDSHERAVHGQILKLMQRMEPEYVDKWVELISYIGALLEEDETK